MKVGSLVMFVGYGYGRSVCIYPDKNKVYTVREIRDNPWREGYVQILVEEITNDCNGYDGIEYGYGIEFWREIITPDNMQYEIEECLTREFIEK